MIRVNYCISIWGTTNTTLLQKVQKIQNFAARITIGGLRKYDHVSPAFTELRWLKVKQIYLFDICVAMYKSLKGIYPHWLQSFSTVQNATSSVTRQRNNLVVPRAKTDTGAKAFSVSGPKMWNSLPENVSSATTLSSFKSRLTKDMLGDTRDR